jgi:hypothetical protein
MLLRETPGLQMAPVVVVHSRFLYGTHRCFIAGVKACYRHLAKEDARINDDVPTRGSAGGMLLRDH